VSNTSIRDNRGGTSGGGIHSRGLLILSDSLVSGNEADQGGGIDNWGTATLTRIHVAANVTASGETGFSGTGYGYTPSGPGDPGGPGGGIHNSGKLDLHDCTLSGNRAGSGGVGGEGNSVYYDAGGGGEGGAGGGIHNSGTLTVNRSTLRDNRSGPGGQGGEGWGDGAGGHGGPGGPGGGIFNTGILTLNDSAVSDNAAGDGGAGGTGSPDGDPGRGGSGGGLDNSGTLTMMLATIEGNRTGGLAALGGSGGGVVNHGGMHATLSRIEGNLAGLGGDGGGLLVTSASSPTLVGTAVISNAVGSGGRGGGVYIAGSAAVMSNLVLGDNVVGTGGLGSGLYAAGSSLQLVHATIAHNSGGDGSGLTVVTSTVRMSNTILVSHTVGISVGLGSTAMLDATLWGSGAWANQGDWGGDGTIVTGTVNYWDAPAFADPEAMDYHIGAASGAVDRGLDAGLDTDIDNQPRPNPGSGGPDLGADEVWVLTPMQRAAITGPSTGTAYAPLSFGAYVTPATATPIISYLWIPEPDTGQWTAAVTYAFAEVGDQEITVVAINAGGRVTATHTVGVSAASFDLYLPLLVRSP
jgi:hypothetical protein